MSFGQLCARRRRVLRVLAVSPAALTSLAFAGGSDAWDARRNILCSGPAGSVPDFVARTVGQRWAAATGRVAVVINRPGASGRISVGALQAAPVGGSTLLLAQGAIATLYPSLFRTLSYDAVADLKPVTMACEMPLALALGPAVPAAVRNVADFLAWGRQFPRALNVGSPGIGTLPHLLEAMLFREAALAWQHVPYPGGPPALTDLLGGHLAALVLPEALLRQYHLSGRVRVVAVSGPTRSEGLPGVATFVEQGHPALAFKEWFAFFAPGRESEAVVHRASEALGEAISSPEVRTAFAGASMTPIASSPAALAQRIAFERQAWRPILRALDLRLD